MQVHIEYRPKTSNDAWDDVYNFRLTEWHDNRVLRRIAVRVANETRAVWVGGWTRNFGPKSKGQAETEFDRAVVRLAVQRIEAMGRTLLEGEDTVGWDLSYEEIDVATKQLKHCAYQERRGRDLHCRAAEREARSHTMTTGTSANACQSVCGLPDTRVLCSAYCHVSITIPANQSPKPTLHSWVCDAGQAERAREVGKCTPGGWDCWRRTIDLSSVDLGERLSPLALNEALDALSWVWRVKFPPPASRLINLAASTPAAEIVLPCTSQEDFRSRMSAIADLLDSLKIDGGLMTPPPPGTKTREGTINRLRDVLQKQLPAADFDRADEGLRELEAVVDLRTGLSHSDAAKKLPRAALRVGFDWPPADWQRAWERVRDHTANAVRVIRQAVAASA